MREPHEPEPEVEAVVAAVNEVEIEKNEKLASEHLPRNCKITKWPDFQGYGFNRIFLISQISSLLPNQLNTLGLLELHLEKKMIEKY
jgi:hypothetical protein